MNDNSLLEKFVKGHFGFREPVKVTLLRSYTNDVYLIEPTNNKKFVLKLYSPEWRNESEILWELDLVNHIANKGVSVARAISSKDGKQVLPYSTEGTNYNAVLFEYAAGSKPKEPFSLALYYDYGKAAAMFHEASNDFRSTNPRPEINLEYLIDDSLSLLKKEISPKEYEYFYNFGSRLKDKITSFIEEGLDWGPLHGDLTLDNLHITENGKITFYDFDSAGFGWRATELQGWVKLYPDKKTAIDSYMKGYLEQRNISQKDIEAAPYLQAAQDMWLRKGMKALKDPKILKYQLDHIEEWIKYFGNSL